MLYKSCRWYLAAEDGTVEAECCHCEGHDGPHHVLFGYIPGSISRGTEGDDGTLVLPDADWQPPTGNPYYVTT